MIGNFIENIFLAQDVKYSASFTAYNMTIEASNFFLEPLARMISTAMVTGGTGHPLLNGVGAAHAAAGGGNANKHFCFVRK